MDIQYLREIVERSDTKVGRCFDLVIQLLILFSAVTFTIETLPNLSDSARHWLGVVETTLVAVFSAEYVLRLAVARNKLGYALSFFGLIDLLAILPFYLSFGIDLRALRVFRLLRVFRILKLVRYSEAIRRFHLALQIAREELVLYVFVTLILLYLSAVGIYFCEHQAQPEVFQSVMHSFWWAIVTLTTVGYGDVYPITFGGRLLTCVILFVGLGVVSVPAGLVASALSKAREIADESDKEDELRNSPSEN